MPSVLLALPLKAAGGPLSAFQVWPSAHTTVLRDRNDLKLLTGCPATSPNGFTLPTKETESTLGPASSLPRYNILYALAVGELLILRYPEFLHSPGIF